MAADTRRVTDDAGYARYREAMAPILARHGGAFGTLGVGIMPRWFAATADESTLYVTNTTPAADRGTVSVIDRVKHTVVATLDVGKAPKDVHMVTVPR